MKYFPLIWAGLWRKKARTILTLLSIVVAFLLFGMLQGVNTAFSAGIDNANVDRLVVINRIALTEQLPLAQQQQIAAVPGVRGVAHSTWMGSFYQERKNFIFAAPVQIDDYAAVVPEVEFSSGAIEALKRTRDGALVGDIAMKKWGWKVGDRVPITSEIWTRTEDGTSVWPLEIIGTYATPKDANQGDSMLFNYDYFDEARAFGKGTVGWYIVRVQDPAQSAQVAEAIDKLFANSPNETRTQTEKEFAQSFIKQFGDINFIVNAILGAVFFTLLFLTGNTMMQSVRERIPELAVLKTLGFSDAKVLGLVISEALLLCVLAAGLGLLCASGLFPALKSFVGEAKLQPSVIWSGIGAAVLLALLIAAPPAWRAMRLNLVDALAGR